MCAALRDITNTYLGRAVGLEEQLSSEYKALDPMILPGGLYIMPQADDMKVWHGIIFVRSGLYASGIFKFKIVFPASYPDSSPKLFFFSTVFHPSVSPSTGELDLGSS